MYVLIVDSGVIPKEFPFKPRSRGRENGCQSEDLYIYMYNERFLWLHSYLLAIDGFWMLDAEYVMMLSIGMLCDYGKWRWGCKLSPFWVWVSKRKDEKQKKLFRMRRDKNQSKQFFGFGKQDDWNLYAARSRAKWKKSTEEPVTPYL